MNTDIQLIYLSYYGDFPELCEDPKPEDPEGTAMLKIERINYDKKWDLGQPIVKPNQCS